MIAVAILKELGPISLRTMMMVRSKLQSLHVGCEARKPAVGTRKNILISGGTSTGKTTFLDALVREIGRTSVRSSSSTRPRLSLSHTRVDAHHPR
jgi:Tfp pilus assembly ATPase PilU